MSVLNTTELLKAIRACLGWTEVEEEGPHYAVNVQFDTRKEAEAFKEWLEEICDSD